MGTSCDKPAGKPYWNQKLVPQDVWATSKYNTFQQYFNGILGYSHGGNDPIVTAQGGITVQTGLGLQEIQNHVLIIHDYDGTRIACGQLVTTGGTNPFLPGL